MDFDHLDDKVRNVSNMVGHNSWDSILEEITKCELVCACCHRLRTKARSSSGEDVILSRSRQEFDSPTGYLEAA